MAQSLVGWPHCFWVMMRQTDHHGRRTWSKAAYLMVARTQKWRGLGTKKVYLSKRVFQLGPTSYFPPPPNNATVPQLCKGWICDEVRAPVSRSLPPSPISEHCCTGNQTFVIGALGNKSIQVLLCDQLIPPGWTRKEQVEEVLTLSAFTDGEVLWLSD